MTSLLFAVFAVQGLLVLLLAGLAAHGPGRLALRAASIVVAAVALLALALGSATLLGHPKPLRLELRAGALDAADLIAVHLVEEEAIHLWLLEPGGRAPRAFALPWRRGLARALLDALGEAERSGGRAELRLAPSGSSSGAEEAELVVHAVPPPALPPKTVPAPQGRPAGDRPGPAGAARQRRRFPIRRVSGTFDASSAPRPPDPPSPSCPPPPRPARSTSGRRS